MKRVTVLLSTYNGQKYIKEQIDSILNQKRVDVNIVIRDDGSTDETKNILNGYHKDSRIKWFEGSNKGCARSFLELIYLCDENTEYYAFSDQDDYWLEKKLYRAIEKLDKFSQEENSLYYSFTKRVGGNLEEISNPFKKVYHVERFPGVILAPSAAGCTMVFNRKLLESLKKYRPGYLWMHDAWVLGVCGAVGGNIYYDAESYILYRQHENNVIGNINKMKLSFFQLLKSRLRKLVDFEYKASLVANEILSGYEDEITKENKELLITIQNVPHKKLKGRLNILQRKYATGYFVIDVKVWLQALLGKL